MKSLQMSQVFAAQHFSARSKGRGLNGYAMCLSLALDSGIRAEMTSAEADLRTRRPGRARAGMV